MEGVIDAWDAVHFRRNAAALVRNRDGKNPALGPIPFFNDPERLTAVLDRFIALIDAMTPDERRLSNVLQISADRRRELAALAGAEIREVQGLIAGRRSVEFVKHVYLDS